MFKSIFTREEGAANFEDITCGQQSTELNTQLTNSLGASKYILTTGKTYNASQITLTQKAHYQHKPQFPTL